MGVTGVMIHEKYKKENRNTHLSNPRRRGGPWSKREERQGAMNMYGREDKDEEGG